MKSYSDPQEYLPQLQGHQQTIQIVLQPTPNIQLHYAQHNLQPPTRLSPHLHPSPPKHQPQPQAQPQQPQSQSPPNAEENISNEELYGTNTEYPPSQPSIFQQLEVLQQMLQQVTPPRPRIQVQLPYVSQTNEEQSFQQSSWDYQPAPQNDNQQHSLPNQFEAMQFPSQPNNEIFGSNANQPSHAYPRQEDQQQPETAPNDYQEEEPQKEYEQHVNHTESATQDYSPQGLAPNQPVHPSPYFFDESTYSPDFYQQEPSDNSNYSQSDFDSYQPPFENRSLQQNQQLQNEQSGQESFIPFQEIEETQTSESGQVPYPQLLQPQFLQDSGSSQQFMHLQPNPQTSEQLSFLEDYSFQQHAPQHPSGETPSTSQPQLKQVLPNPLSKSHIPAGNTPKTHPLLKSSLQRPPKIQPQNPNRKGDSTPSQQPPPQQHKPTQKTAPAQAKPSAKVPSTVPTQKVPTAKPALQQKPPPQKLPVQKPPTTTAKKPAPPKSALQPKPPAKPNSQSKPTPLQKPAPSKPAAKPAPQNKSNPQQKPPPPPKQASLQKLAPGQPKQPAQKQAPQQKPPAQPKPPAGQKVGAPKPPGVQKLSALSKPAAKPAPPNQKHAPGQKPPALKPGAKLAPKPAAQHKPAPQIKVEKPETQLDNDESPSESNLMSTENDASPENQNRREMWHNYRVHKWRPPHWQQGEPWQGPWQWQNWQQPPPWHQNQWQQNMWHNWHQQQMMQQQQMQMMMQQQNWQQPGQWQAEQLPQSTPQDSTASTEQQLVPPNLSLPQSNEQPQPDHQKSNSQPPQSSESSPSHPPIIYDQQQLEQIELILQQLDTVQLDPQQLEQFRLIQQLYMQHRHDPQGSPQDSQHNSEPQSSSEQSEIPQPQPVITGINYSNAQFQTPPLLNPHNLNSRLGLPQQQYPHFTENLNPQIMNLPTQQHPPQNPNPPNADSQNQATQQDILNVLSQLNPVVPPRANQESIQQNQNQNQSDSFATFQQQLLLLYWLQQQQQEAVLQNQSSETTNDNQPTPPTAPPTPPHPGKTQKRKREPPSQVDVEKADLLLVPRAKLKRAITSRTFHIVHFASLCPNYIFPSELAVYKVSFYGKTRKLIKNKKHFHSFINPGPIPQSLLPEVDFHSIPFLNTTASQLDYAKLVKGLSEFVENSPDAVFYAKDPQFVAECLRWISRHAGDQKAEWNVRSVQELVEQIHLSWDSIFVPSVYASTVASMDRHPPLEFKCEYHQGLEKMQGDRGEKDKCVLGDVRITVSVLKKLWKTLERK